jgi:hypothetical protein
MAAIDEHARTQRKARFLRPDAWRYVRPKASDGVPWRTTNAAAEDRATFIAEIASIRSSLAALRLCFAAIVARKYDPDQPRIPAGQQGGGQWTDGDGGESERRVRLAGEIPTGGLPEIPEKRPASEKERNRVARSAARRLGSRIWVLIEAGSWLIEKAAEISSYFDSPRSLEELQQAASTPAPGYDIHHIVERSSALDDDFTVAEVDNSDNLARVPRWKHWEITGWFQQPNEEFGRLPPREYLRGKSWEERRRVGIRVLIEKGVLKP